MYNNSYNKKIADEVRKLTLAYLKQDAKSNFGGKNLIGRGFFDDLWSATSQGINTGLSILPAVLPFMGAGKRKVGRPRKLKAGAHLYNMVQFPEQMDLKGGDFFSDLGGIFQKALPLLPLIAAGKKAKKPKAKYIKGGNFESDMIEGVLEGLGKPKGRGRPRKGGIKLNQIKLPEMMNLQGDGILDDIFNTVNKGFSGLEKGLDIFDKGADVLNKYHRRGTKLVNKVKNLPSRLNKRITGGGSIDDFLKNTFDTIDRGFETYDKFNKYKQRFGRGKKMTREERGLKVKELMKKHNCSLGEASKMLKSM